MPLTILAGGSWTPHPQLITTIHRGHLVTKPEVILQSFSIPHVTRTSYMYILKCLSVLHPAPPPGSHPFSLKIFRSPPHWSPSTLSLNLCQQ